MQRPIFILGTMRSGSTLFRLILDAHPNIAISEETGFMGALAANKAIPSWLYGREWYGRLGWSEQEVDDRLREFYSGMFERYAVAQGKSRWGDKTPFHFQHIEEMARLFPEAVFVAIVRHPGAVVHSLKRWFHYEILEAANYWEGANVEILRHGAELGDDRFALVRYEDVVGHPETTLREVMSWLDEPWSDDLLHHNDVMAKKGAPRVVDGGTSTRDPIRAERADRWIKALGAAERDVVVATTSGLAGFLGYDPAEAREPADIVPANSAGHRKLLTGGLLAQRQREQRDRISFAPRQQEIVVPEISTAELVKRLQCAEAALARIRRRRAVRLSDAVRRVQRRLVISPAAELLSALRRRLGGNGQDGESR
ncbi:MAG: sulfotransferase [Actinobacteria bacterium]|nr:sulfotransferase [Actinomycetota bacterium]